MVEYCLLSDSMICAMACGNVCTPTRFVQRKLYIIEHNSINIHDGGGWCTTVDVVVVVVDVVVVVVDVV